MRFPGYGVRSGCEFHLSGNGAGAAPAGVCALNRLDIDLVWEDFRALAEPAMAGEDDGADDIREACRAGEAWLFGDAEGYLVLQYQLRPATRSMQLLVWVAVSRGARGCIGRQLPFVEELGRRLGASRVLFRTRRKGFDRIMPPGWRADHIIWTRGLGDG